MIDQRLSPPVAAPRPIQLRTHDDVRTDPYFWLRERANPDVIAYLEAENAYTEAVMSDTVAVQQALFDEMRSRIKESDQSAPVQIDDYFDYERTEAGKQYNIYCRKQRSMNDPEEILLDLNQEAEGHDYLRLANFSVSPDHKRLAYALDSAGSEVYTLHIKDLTTHDLLPDVIPNTYYGLEWANDNHTLYYLTLDQAMRPDKLWRHTLGTDPAQDELLFHEDNESYELLLSKVA